MPAKNVLIPSTSIENKIVLLLGKKVVLDSDLAALYGMKAKAFNRAVATKPRTLPG